MADSNGGNTSRVFMLAAVVLGVLAMVMAFAYIQNAANVNQLPKIKMVVAAHDLAPTASLNPETDLKTIDVPMPTNPVDAHNLQDRMLDPKSMDSYRGLRVNRPIMANGLIQLTDLGGQSKDVMMPTGDQCALSIGVRGANALSGLVVPGDYVRLFVTRPKTGAPAEGDNGSKWETVGALPGNAESLRVIAVDNRPYVPRVPVAWGDQTPSGSVAEAQHTITLLVTQAQAQMILSMTGAGQLPVTVVLTPPPAAGFEPPSSATAPHGP